jgi:hypothetical protein
LALGELVGFNHALFSYFFWNFYFSFDDFLNFLLELRNTKMQIFAKLKIYQTKIFRIFEILV